MCVGESEVSVAECRYECMICVFRVILRSSWAVLAIEYSAFCESFRFIGRNDGWAAAFYRCSHIKSLDST